MTHKIFFYIASLFSFLFSLNIYSQESITDTIRFSDEQAQFLTFNKDFSANSIDTFSENKSCYLSKNENHFFIASIVSTYKDAQYYNTLDIRCVDTLGNSLWTFIFNDFKQVAYKDIYATSDGVYILYEGYLTNGLARDCYLTKLSLSGMRLWDVNFGKKYGTGILDIMKLDKNGDLIMCTKSFETSYIYRISPQGDVIQAAGFTDGSELTIMDFDFDEAGNIYTIGHITTYPDKKYTQEAFVYKLNNDFKLIADKHFRDGKVAIANSIKHINDGHFAVHISTKVDFNRPKDQIFSQFSLMDTDLNISNNSGFLTNNSASHQVFRQVSDDKIITLHRLYINKNSYYGLLEFDHQMNYQKSTLLNFNTGMSDYTYQSNGNMLWVKYSEVLFWLDDLKSE